MAVIKHDSRSCFGIDFYATEQEADSEAAIVKKRGDTYNGGFMHGTLCGRDRGFDYFDALHGQLFAVTVR